MLAIVLGGNWSRRFRSWSRFLVRRRRSNQILAILLLAAAILVLLSYLVFPGELIRAPAGVFDLRWWQIAVAVRRSNVPGRLRFRHPVSVHCS